MDSTSAGRATSVECDRAQKRQKLANAMRVRRQTVEHLFGTLKSRMVHRISS